MKSLVGYISFFTLSLLIVASGCGKDDHPPRVSSSIHEEEYEMLASLEQSEGSAQINVEVIPVPPPAIQEPRMVDHEIGQIIPIQESVDLQSKDLQQEIATVIFKPSKSHSFEQKVQIALANLHLYGGEIDGKIGSATRSAIKAFQSKHGLEPDGLTGPKTWEKLKQHYYHYNKDELE